MSAAERLAPEAARQVALLRRADARLSKFNPLPRILSCDDFDDGINGWTQLIGNYDDDLGQVKPMVRDMRPAQLSNCTFFDVGSHGSVDGVYALKLATRPRAGASCYLIKRLTYAARTMVQVECYFTYKAEANFDPALKGPQQFDGNYHPSESMFGDFTLGNDVCDGADGKRYLCALRYQNTDFEGRFVRKWLYKTSLHATTRMQVAGAPVPEDIHTLRRDDWAEVPGGDFPLCSNEIPTKVNWHYLRWQFDLAARRNVELQVNDRVMNLRHVPVPAYPDAYHGLDRLLNVYFDVRTHLPARNFLFLDSVLISADW